MLKKLLKYDFLWTWHTWWILIPTILSLSFVSSFVLRFVIAQSSMLEPTMPVLYILGVLFLGFAYFALIVSVVLTPILVYVRFFTHLFTDQGYLTFTLPVKRREILLAKFLNALFWEVLHILLLLVSLLFFFLFSPPATEKGQILNFVVFQGIGNALQAGWQSVGGFLILYILLGILLLILLGAFSISLIFFCITFASTVVKRAKLLLAVGIYYGATSVMSFFTSIFGTFGSVIFAEGFIALLYGQLSFLQNLSVTVLLLLGCVAVATLSALFYFITQNILERKLNLA